MQVFPFGAQADGMRLAFKNVIRHADCRVAWCVGKNNKRWNARKKFPSCCFHLLTMGTRVRQNFIRAYTSFVCRLGCPTIQITDFLIRIVCSEGTSESWLRVLLPRSNESRPASLIISSDQNKQKVLICIKSNLFCSFFQMTNKISLAP